MDCSICLSPFQKTPSRKQAKCPYCDIEACVKCTQTYLIGSHEDPHCMGCRKGWSREVLDSFCLITWIDGDYKKHRQNILLDRERSRLPAAQIAHEHIQEGKERKLQNTKLLEQVQETLRLYNTLNQQYLMEERNIQYLLRGQPVPESGVSAKQVEEKRVFVMPCPAEDCRGFLSTAYKCGVCEQYTCSECREVKGNHDAEHTCNPSTVATVRALKKECRNCPECGTNIFRVEGCAQMFCTQCHTAFDWTSGRKITNGAIHNPHYFDYIRQLNGGAMPRNPGDIPCGDRLPNVWSISALTRNYSQAQQDILYKGLRTFTHIRHVEIPRYTNRAEDVDHTDINVRYLTKELTEAKWKEMLQNREKKRMRKDEIRTRLEAFLGAANDIYSQVMTVIGHESRAKKDEKEAAVELCIQQLLQIRSLFNAEMAKISYRYRCTTLEMKDDMGLTTQKAPRTAKKASSETVSETVSVEG